MNRERDERREPPRRSRSPNRHRSRSRERKPRDRDRDRSPRRPRSRSPPRKRSRSRSLSPARRRSRSPTRRRPRSSSPARRRSRSPARVKTTKRRRHSRSSSSSSSSGDSDHGRRRHRKRSRSRSRSRSRERKDKDKDKKRKHHDKDKKSKDKKEKKSKKKKKTTVASEWGKFGIINESDLYNKDPEFRTWLLEERKINPETISKDQTRKQFAKFVEDYNTGTLPHEKYYNLARYEARMSLVRSGEALPTDDAGYDFTADVAAHASAIKRTVRAAEEGAGTSYSREELQELRRVQNERVQLGKMKVLGMDIKTSMGVRMVENDTFDGD